MATTIAPLIWETTRTVGGYSDVGGVVHYRDGYAQSLYLKNHRISTKTETIINSQWKDSIIGENIDITPNEAGRTYNQLSLDHPIDGTVYGITINNNSLEFIRYTYGRDISTLITSYDHDLQSDNPITQISFNVQNVGPDIFGTEATLFNPGAKLVVRFRMGNSELYPMGVFWVDDFDYDERNADVSISGRNTIGLFLKDQTFDSYITIQGSSKYISDFILYMSGVRRYEIEELHGTETDPDNLYVIANTEYDLKKKLNDIQNPEAFSDTKTYAVGDYVARLENSVDKVYRCLVAITTPGAWDASKWALITNNRKELFKKAYTFNPDTTFNSALDDISNMYVQDSIRYEGYGLVETPDGTILLGTDEFKSAKLPNTTYPFELGTDIFSRKTTKNMDAAYSKIRVDGKILAKTYGPGTSWHAGDYMVYDIPEYNKNDDYEPGMFVKYSGKVYYTPFGVWRGLFNTGGNPNWELAIIPPELTPYFQNTSEFDRERDYSVGDYCKNAGILYVCIRDIRHDFNYDGHTWVYLGEEDANIFKFKDGTPVLEIDGKPLYSNWEYIGSDAHIPLTKVVPTYDFWEIGEHKTKHISAPYPITTSDFDKWAEDQAEMLAYTGITEDFTGPFRPQLLVGDVAQVSNEGTTTVIGLITSVKHSFSRTTGFGTDFTVDSGGVKVPSGSVAGYFTKSSNVNGYNRKQKLSDLIKILTKR